MMPVRARFEIHLAQQKVTYYIAPNPFDRNGYGLERNWKLRNAEMLVSKSKGVQNSILIT